MKTSLNFIDNFLNSITMYRLMLYGLLALAAVAIALSFFGLVPYSPLYLFLSLVILFVVSFFSNYFFGKLFKAPLASESSYITGLILFFIVSPTSLGWGVLVAIIAMASKFILAIHKKHLFNPAAISLVIIGLFGIGVGLWWVGSLAMLIPTLIFGLLVLRKMRRFSMFGVFFVASLVSISVVGVSNGISLFSIFSQLFSSWPIIFFGTIMLTEPQTVPSGRTMQMIYGGLVGVLFGAQFHLGPLYSTPELALVLGNIFSYIVSPKTKLFLKLKEKNLLASNTYEFVFELNQKFKWKAGQYLEWTLPHQKNDTRGNRRYFTIASSPAENEIRLGIRTAPVKPSTFKQALVDLPEGGTIVASGLAGEFTLPKHSRQKLVFISGGIGITPFRSMIAEMFFKKEMYDVVHFYSNKTMDDIAYKDLLFRAPKVGVKTVYVLTDTTAVPENWQGEIGQLDKQKILKHVPDYMERMFYLSGPHAMVDAFEKMLRNMGVKKYHIKVDFFPGF